MSIQDTQDYDDLHRALVAIGDISKMYSDLSHFLQCKILSQSEYENACNRLREELDRAVSLSIDILNRIKSREVSHNE